MTSSSANTSSRTSGVEQVDVIIRHNASNGITALDTLHDLANPVIATTSNVDC
jgi:hypothetical protein